MNLLPSVGAGAAGKRRALLPEPNPTGKSATSRTDELVDDMEETIPPIRDFLPLASGIEEELDRHYGEDPTWRIIAALKRHVAKPAYQRAILRYQQRVDLSGEPKGEISEDERTS